MSEITLFLQIITTTTYSQEKNLLTPLIFLSIFSLYTTTTNVPGQLSPRIRKRDFIRAIQSISTRPLTRRVYIRVTRASRYPSSLLDFACRKSIPTSSASSRENEHDELRIRRPPLGAIKHFYGATREREQLRLSLSPPPLGRRPRHAGERRPWCFRDLAPPPRWVCRAVRLWSVWENGL